MKASLRIAAGMAEWPALTAWLDAQVEAFGLEGAQAYALRLCIEELAGNVVMHGAAEALQVTLDTPPLRLLIEDDGPAFDPVAVPMPALPGSLEEARAGGLGLLLTRHYAQGLDYARDGGWNRVSVRL